MIQKLLTESLSSETADYIAGDIVFSAGDNPIYFYFIIKGKVKLVSKDGDSKELIQEINKEKHGIAEFSVFVEEPYPATAVAMTDCQILKLPLQEFFRLLQESDELKLFLLKNISDSIYQKYLMADIRLKRNSARKIILLLNYLKRKHTDNTPYSFHVLLTRQNIADLAGLRVETVIRTVKKLEENKVLKIINSKIFY